MVGWKQIFNLKVTTFIIKCNLTAEMPLIREFLDIKKLFSYNFYNLLSVLKCLVPKYTNTSSLRDLLKLFGILSFDSEFGISDVNLALACTTTRELRRSRHCLLRQVRVIVRICTP